MHTSIEKHLLIYPTLSFRKIIKPPNDYQVGVDELLELIVLDVGGFIIPLND
jgi:hypothetical protein